MSFTGSALRLKAAIVHQGRHWAVSVLEWFALYLVVGIVWSFLLVYSVIVFGLFGLLVIPFRSHRRSQRKQTQLLETIAKNGATTVNVNVSA